MLAALDHYDYRPESDKTFTVSTMQKWLQDTLIAGKDVRPHRRFRRMIGEPSPYLVNEIHSKKSIQVALDSLTRKKLLRKTVSGDVDNPVWTIDTSNHHKDNSNSNSSKYSS